MFSRSKVAAAIVAALFLSTPALALTTVLDQVPAPTDQTGSSEILTQSVPVTGGTLYLTTLKTPGPQGPLVSEASSFVSTAATAPLRYLALTNAKSDAGVALTASATAGAVGVARTAGTSLTLVGEATSSSAKTDKAFFELSTSDAYQAAANIPVTVNANYTGSGTITGASTTLTVTAYTEVNGVETALTVSAAQQFTATAANYVFTITGTALAPGQHIAVEVAMLVTSSSGANTGQINSVALQD